MMNIYYDDDENSLLLLLIHYIIPAFRRNIRAVGFTRVSRLQQPQEQRYPAAVLTWITRDSRAYEIIQLCVRVHTGVGHTDSESTQHF